ncbi:hypothetical protein R1sor_021615 [Riccia sorocarpa]|uniref:Protein disulfide-isomerase SCO2 n=1 Tax=Riccia sorocarpa TaxID=122646 RepID=A0ABD3GJQ2_9MARC
MIGSVELLPFTRPHQSCTRVLSCCPPRRTSFRGSVCCLGTDPPAVPFPRINATEIQGQSVAQDAEKFGRRSFEIPRRGSVDDNGSVKAKAKPKRNYNHDSSLDPDEPLPLPMTFPDSEPAPREKIEEMLNCDVETEDCKEVVYQWTGECRACQGTGLVSFYRKKHEVISTCINCLGIGYVHKITSRADIEDMDGTKGNGRKPRT